MQLADFIISYSLQINNRCLRYLADCDASVGLWGVVSEPRWVHQPQDLAQNGQSGVGDTGLSKMPAKQSHQAEMHTVYAESLLARDSRRLQSMWSLVNAGEQTDNTLHTTHQRQLATISELLADATSVRRLALRLASIAQDDAQANAMLLLARQLPAPDPLTWDELSELYACDSKLWRERTSRPDISNHQVVETLQYTYRKGFKYARRLTGKKGESRKWLDKRHMRLTWAAQSTAHQLELLRPGLSDSGRAQLWYLDKMADTLRMRAGLVALEQQQSILKMKKSQRSLARGYIDLQIGKMDRRIVRLLADCYSVKPKKFDALLQRTTDSLGLEKVALVSPADQAVAVSASRIDNGAVATAEAVG